MSQYKCIHKLSKLEDISDTASRQDTMKMMGIEMMMLKTMRKSGGHCVLESQEEGGETSRGMQNPHLRLLLLREARAALASLL